MSALMAVDDALAQLLALARAAPLEGVEQLPLRQADGRVLAEGLRAGIDLPPWANSAMDGYAMRLDDLATGPLPVSQTVFAGQAPEPLRPGTCARLFTGAPVPAGADCVQLQENCEVDGQGRVSSLTLLRRGDNIRAQGNEIRAGAALLAAGTVLDPIALGVLASQGITQVPVLRRPRVALLSSGDELAAQGARLAPGQIHDSNRVLLSALLARLGCEVIDLGCLPDDPQHIRAALLQAAGADLIVSSAGVSVGDADCIGTLLRESGEVRLWKLAIKPGKPFTFGYIDRVPFLGLPGNPGSALVTFLLLARPYLLARMGVARVQPMRMPVVAGFAWPKPGKRQEYLRVRLDGGRARLLENQSSATLLSAVEADGLLEVPAGETFEAGDVLDFIAFAGVF
ncbi:MULTISPECIES: gephyrin-like molybdotransferase Glp [unclassified Pseudomonas]|uniref:molybdopterin molybdotransferase MoeA n=1 Tax=unclassified Pseudomonas TaxID=196821 RepID=UPI0024488772|nr:MULTISPECIES: gephyrin-like molybdotransferase Glp [unclassified Pseudomonas]MDH0301624.1 molybdopterin molybdotransferase MoeA [Pseudomonas sp. GD04091]MDH1987266.1 molybdopterin molybdotransferase MoeA [Pseudomonas sp. GD03689]